MLLFRLIPFATKFKLYISPESCDGFSVLQNDLQFSLLDKTVASMQVKSNTRSLIKHKLTYFDLVSAVKIAITSPRVQDADQ